MKHVSLFTGIGGFELAAQRVWGSEYEPVLFCEKDQYCRRVLQKHWTHVPIVEDIVDVRHTDSAFLLTGGFPCQPFSLYGRRRGRESSRFLWPQMLRVIHESKPTWVVAENVRGILTVERGMAFEQVHVDLEQEGYEAQSFVIPALACDAPHKRDRVWFVATIASGEDTNGIGSQAEFQRQRCEWVQEPSVPRVVDGVSCRVDRLRCIGNAVVPAVAEQIFLAIKESNGHRCITGRSR